MPHTTTCVDLPSRPTLQVHLHGGGTAADFLLVHGLASNARLWDGVGRALAAEGHGAVAVDLRGHGGSQRGDGDFGYTSVCGDLVALADALGLQRPVLVGQSWGGNVVLEAAARHPERFAAVCGVDGGFIALRASYPDADAAWEALSPPDLIGTPGTEVEEMIAQRTAGWPDGSLEAVLANFERREDGTVAPRLRLEDHERIVRHMWAADPVESMRSVTVPVLLLAVTGGEGEWARRKQEMVDRALQALPDGRARWLDGDHDIHLQQPDVVAAELLGLQRLTS